MTDLEKLKQAIVTEALAQSDKGRELLANLGANNPLAVSSASELRCSCGGSTQHRHRLGSPYSGALVCESCGKSESFMRRIGRELIKVEPLPQGAMPLYDRDPT